MAADEELLTRAVHDRFGGWYDADVAWMGRALRPGLVKRSPAGDGGAILTKGAMLRACAEGEGTRDARPLADDRHRGCCGDIASAVSRPAPYRGHLHLIRTGGGWKIENTLWLLR